jgi:hypothetical protein
MSYFCSSPWYAAGLPASCDYFCANTSERWSIQALIDGMSAFIPKAFKTCLTQCDSNKDGTGDLPYCNETALRPTCECGADMLSCYPLNPATGTRYS